MNNLVCLQAEDKRILNRCRNLIPRVARRPGHIKLLQGVLCLNGYQGNISDNPITLLSQCTELLRESSSDIDRLKAIEFSLTSFSTYKVRPSRFKQS